MKISCIVPVYNNETTLEHVLSVLTSIDEIDEVIVGDDASSDKSYKIAQEFGSKIRLFRNEKNLGKGGNVVKGIKMSKGDVLFFCDADLSKLDKKHVMNLINTFKDGNYDMVIGASGGESTCVRAGIRSCSRLRNWRVAVVVAVVVVVVVDVVLVAA